MQKFIEKIKTAVVVFFAVCLCSATLMLGLSVIIALYNGMHDDALANGVFTFIFYLAAHAFTKRVIKERF